MFFKNKRKQLLSDKNKSIVTEVEKIIKKDGKITKVIEKENIDSNNKEITYDDIEGSNYEKVVLKTTYVSNENDIKSKNNEEVITKRLKWITFVYLMTILFSLFWILYSIASDNSSGNYKSIYITLITVLFGTGAKSFYKILLLKPYNLDEEKFKKNSDLNSLKTSVELFIDVISGLAIIFYVLKFYTVKNIFDKIGLPGIFVVLITLLIITNIFTGVVDKEK